MFMIMRSGNGFEVNRIICVVFVEEKDTWVSVIKKPLTSITNMKISLKISIYQITRYENDSQFLRSWDQHERTCAGIQYVSCYFGLELFQNCCSLKRNKAINWNLQHWKYPWSNGESVDEVLWQQLIVNDSLLKLCWRKHWGGFVLSLYEW